MSYVTPKVLEAQGRDICAEAVEMQQRGLTLSEVARSFNLKVGTLAGYLAKCRQRLEGENRGHPDGKPPRMARESVRKYARRVYGRDPKDLLREWFRLGMNGTDMAQRLMCNNGTIKYNLNQLGIQLTLAESRRLARTKGRIDYSEIMKKNRLHAIRMVAKGSETAQRVFLYLKDALLQHPLNNFDIVVGMNEWGIIAPLEVDVPVVAVYRSRDTLWGRHSYTFAIEVDGEQWHPKGNVRDPRKDEILRNAGWHPLRLYVPKNASEDQIRTETTRLAEELRSILRDWGEGE